jgi:hypothetical protein
VELATSSTVLATFSPTATAADLVVEDPFTFSSSLRSVKSALKKLQSSTVADLVDASDFVALKEVLRVPPVSEVRRAGTKLISSAGGSVEEADSLAATLHSHYKAFIASLELMDSTASLGMRGRTLTETEFRESYVKTLASLQTLVDRAAAAVPVAETETS